MARIWAKSFKQHNKERTLKEHIEDIKKSWQNLKNKLSLPDEIPKAVDFCIDKHDLGKVLPAFQIKHLGNKTYEPWDILLDIPHSLFSIFWIRDDELNSFNEKTRNFILSAIAFHHWRENFENFLIRENVQLKRLACELASNGNFVKALQENLKNELNKDISLNERIIKGIANGSILAKFAFPPYLNMFLPYHLDFPDEEKKKWILIAGFLQRCDHFVSFCEEEIESLDKIEIEPAGFGSVKNRVKEKIGVDNESKIWQIQKIKDCKDKNLILIAPTGFGKTEFAFLWSADHKFVYTLPLRSAVNQIFDRGCDIFGNGKTGILHSDADVYLLEKSGDATDNTRANELARNLSYPAIIATGDQFFPYALKPPGYEKIHSLFSYADIIIDEVQAYNPKACAIVVKFIEDVTRMGGNFLLMTATLPRFVKKKIEERIGNNFRLINIYEDYKNDFEKIIKHKAGVRLIDNGSNAQGRPDFTLPDEEIDNIVNLAQQGKRVLVILNTVKQAQECYKILKSKFNNEDKVFLIHSRFTLEDRRNKEVELIEREFKNPKPSNENKGKILVATQVVEASLDIDADILFTEICPLDALVQRMGRVARRYFYNDGKVINKADNKEYELTAEFEACKNYNSGEPNVYIWIFKNGLESGNGNVYKKELLKLSMAWLWKKSKGDIENLDFNEENSNEFFNQKFSMLFEGQASQRVSRIRHSKNQIIMLEKIISDDSWIENLQNFPISINEYGKYEIVELFYIFLREDGEYLKDFYLTLDVLDAGWMSDKKIEAEKTFREIYDIQVIPENLLNDFINAIKDFDFNNKKYTHFKKEILSKFVVSCPFKFSETAYTPVIYRVMEKMDDKDKINKLGRWLKGIYLISAREEEKVKYEKNLGLLKCLDEKNEKQREENIL